MTNRQSRLRAQHRVMLVAIVLVTFSGAAALVPSSVSGAATPPASYGEGSTFCSTAVPGGKDLGYSYDNVYACGPANNSGTGYFVPASGTYKGYFEDSKYEYQCTELADRFLFDIWGKAPVSGSSLDGASFAATVASQRSVPLVKNGTAGKPYLPGDIVSFTDGGDGHVAVVATSTETRRATAQ